MLLALLSAEVFCRAYYFEQQTFVPELGFVFAPSSRVVHGVEGWANSYWSDYGFRGRKPLNQTEPGRVLVQGDSFTEGLSVGEGQVYTSLLERKLREAGRNLSVINAGRSGTSVADYLSNARFYLERVNPTWVVIQVRDSDFLSEAWESRPGRANFVRTNGTLETIAHPLLRPQGVRGMFHKVLNESAALRFSLVRIQQFKLWLQNEPPLFTQSRNNSAKPQVRAEDYPVEQELVDLTSVFRNRCTILYLPDYSWPSGTSVTTETGQRLAKAANERNYSFVRVDWSRSSLKEDGKAPFGFLNSGFNTGHLNAAGHTVAAHQLFEELDRAIASHGLYQP